MSFGSGCSNLGTTHLINRGVALSRGALIKQKIQYGATIELCGSAGDGDETETTSCYVGTWYEDGEIHHFLQDP